jgi:hypothetical protein
VPEEPPSDDFHSFIPLAQADVFGADEQVSVYTRTRALGFHPLGYWQNTPAELRHLTTLALRVLGFLSTSACGRGAFSVARSVTGDYQMAMTQETISARDDPGELPDRPAPADWRVCNGADGVESGLP